MGMLFFSFLEYRGHYSRQFLDRQSRRLPVRRDWQQQPISSDKKELISAGISIAVLIATILGIKNKDVLLELWENLKELVTKPSAPLKKLHDIVPGSPTVHAIEEEKIPVVVKATECVNIPQYSFDVRGHIRNLHSGWKASAKKISEAEMLGITLLPGQTLVDGYKKGGLSA